MARGEAVLVRVGIVGSWWLMDDAIHALFASEAKRSGATDQTFNEHFLKQAAGGLPCGRECCP